MRTLNEIYTDIKNLNTREKEIEKRLNDYQIRRLKDEAEINEIVSELGKINQEKFKLFKEYNKHQEK